MNMQCILLACSVNILDYTLIVIFTLQMFCNALTRFRTENYILSLYVYSALMMNVMYYICIFSFVMNVIY